MRVLSQGKREHLRCRAFDVVDFCIRDSLVVGFGWWSMAVGAHTANWCKSVRATGPLRVTGLMPFAGRAHMVEPQVGGQITDADQYRCSLICVPKDLSVNQTVPIVIVATMALQQRPNIDLFYGNSDEMGIGACIAAEKLGRRINEDVWCVSIDGNDITLDLVEEGKTTATLGVYPNLMGKVVIQQMEKVLNGEEVSYILDPLHRGGRHQRG